MSAAARLFVAVDLPVGARETLTAWAREHAGPRDDLRLVAEDALHVTLAFLGDLPLARAEAIERAVAAVVDGPVPLGLGGALWLAPRRPHVLTVAIEDPAGALVALHDRVAGALAKAVGYAPDPRPFRPHATVARVRRGARVRPVSLPAPPRMRFGAEAVALYRSRLGRGGARYEAVARVSLP